MKIVPKDDPVLNDCYKELMDYLGWPEVIERNGVYRFKGKPQALMIQKVTDYKIYNELALAYIVHKTITLEEWMQFYIDTETSLYAFLEVFERRIWPQDEEDEK